MLLNDSYFLISDVVYEARYNLCLCIPCYGHLSVGLRTRADTGRPLSSFRQLYLHTRMSHVSTFDPEPESFAGCFSFA